MKLRIAALLAIIGAASLGAWWWVGKSTGTQDAAQQTGPSDAEVVRRKRATRSRASVDRAPCRARGRVTRKDNGAALENAVVQLRRGPMYAALGREPIVVTAAAGGRWARDGIPPGRYVLTATAPGLLPGLRKVVELEPGKEYVDLDLELGGAGVLLRGTLADPDGKPVVGADVAVISVNDTQTTSQPEYVTRSDATGAYAHTLVRGHYAVTIRHPDFMQRVHSVALNTTQRQVDLELTPGAVVTGVVRARADKRPVPGAHVRLASKGAFMGASVHQGIIATHADADGKFTLRGLPGGSAQLEAVAAGHGTVESTDVPLAVGERVEGVEILTDRAYSISGFVVEQGDETRGIGGVMVNAVDFAHTSQMAAAAEASTADGHFELIGLAPGRYVIIAIGDSVVPSMMGANVTIEDRDETDVLIRLDRGTMLEGRVDPPGPALVRASVDVDFKNMGILDMPRLLKSMMSTMRAARAEADGTFAYGPIAKGVYKLTAVASDGTYAQMRFDTDKDTTPIQLHMEAGSSVRGRVVDGAGKPLAGVTVAFHPQLANPALSMSSLFGGSGDDSVTDPQGYFAVGGLAPGSYTASVRSDRMLRLPWANPADPAHPLRPRHEQVGAKEDRVVEYVVTRGTALRGTVRDAAGRTVAGAWVSASPQFTSAMWSEVFDAGEGMGASAATQRRDDDEEPSVQTMTELGRMLGAPPVRTDEHGAFSIPGQFYSTYALTVEADRGRLRAAMTVDDLGEPIEVRLQSVGRLMATLGGGEDPGGHHRLVLQGPEAHYRGVHVDAETFAVERLLPGEYTVHLSADGGAITEAVTIEPGEASELALPLKPWGVVTGRVVTLADRDPAGGLGFISMQEGLTMDNLMSGASDMLSIMSGGTPRVTDGDGRFEVGRLPEGVTTISFHGLPTMSERAAVRVDLSASERRDVGDVLALPPELDKDVERGWLGLRVHDNDKEGTLTVRSVDARGPAADAGVRPEDQVRTIDGIGVPDPLPPSVAENLIEGPWNTVGHKRTLGIVRGEAKLEVTVTATRRKKP